MTDLLGPHRLKGQGILFYTDDVGLFSATRRLSRDGDPPQPAIDSKLTNQGSDMVFEPLANFTRSLTNNLGRLDLNVEGLGFDFTDNSEFNHGTLRLQATQDLPSSTRAQARFYYAPNQFLGNNEERQSGQLLQSAERFTSYIWSTRLIHDVTPDLSLRLLDRYGMRRYNEAARSKKEGHLRGPLEVLLRSLVTSSTSLRSPSPPLSPDRLASNPFHR